MNIKIIIQFIIYLLLANFAYAQQNKLSSFYGIVEDSITHLGMQNTTIKILKENKIVSSGFSNENGVFIIDNLPFDNYVAQFSFVGYKNLEIHFSLKLTDTFYNAGIINLQLDVIQLAAVTIKKQLPPIVIKRDTIEYNSDSFKTHPNSTISDLIKKLPGLVIDRNSEVTAQGSEIERIYVDGKPFFGGSKKLALQILPAEIVDKIQIYSGLSDQSNFTGVDDGQHIKTLNIITKKSKRNGYFGNVKGGIASKNLYSTNAAFNQFNDSLRITLFGQSNNSNFNGVNGIFPIGRLSGVTKNTSSGINFTQNVNTKTNIYGSYYFDQAKLTSVQKTLTKYFSTDSLSQISQQNLSSISNNNTHQLQFNLERNFDEKNSIIVKGNLGFDSKNEKSSKEESVEKGLINLNSAQTKSGKTGKNLMTNFNFLYRHKFEKSGRTLSINSIYDYRHNTNQNNYESILNYINKNKPDSINQLFHDYSPNKSWSNFISYTEPISDKALLELSLNMIFLESYSNKNTYNFNLTENKYNLLDNRLSNKYSANNNQSTLSLNYQYNSEKIKLNVGSGLQAIQMMGNNSSFETKTSRSFLNIYPTVNVNYQSTNTKSIQLGYSGRTSQPSLQQLQPIIDQRDPLYVVQGNPDLKPAFTNSFQLSYTSTNEKNFSHLFVNLQANLIKNQILNSLILSNNGITYNSFINTNGNLNFLGSISYGFLLDEPDLNFGITTSISNTKYKTLINKLFNNNTNYLIGESFRINYRLNDELDISCNITPSYSFIKSSSLNHNQQDEYFNGTMIAEINYNNSKGWIFSSTFDYTSNKGISSGYNGNVALWNLSLGKYLLKNKLLESRIVIFDLLNQNKIISRSVTSSYIQDIERNGQTRLFMLSLSYNLKSFKSK